MNQNEILKMKFGVAIDLLRKSEADLEQMKQWHDACNTSIDAELRRRAEAKK